MKRLSPRSISLSSVRNAEEFLTQFYINLYEDAMLVPTHFRKMDAFIGNDEAFVEDWLVRQGLEKLVDAFRGMFFSILDIYSLFVSI